MNPEGLKSMAARALPWIAAAVPPLLVLVLIGAWRQRVPFYDDWEFVNYYRDLESGKLDWRSLFDHYNEHRLVVLKATIVAMFQWFDGDWGVLCYLSFAIALGILAQILILARPILARSRATATVVCAAVSLAVFSPTQGQDWLWGITFVVFLPVFLLLASILVLRTGWPAWLRFAVCLLLSRTAAYSHGMGVVIWVAIAVYLLMAEARPGAHGKRGRSWFLGTWIALGILLTLAHFLDYRMSPIAEESTGSLVSKLPLGISFLGVVLGGHLGIGTAVSDLTLSALLGVALILGFAGALVWLWRCRRDRALWHAAAPWCALCVASLLAGGLITGSRFGIGLGQALETRYNTSCLYFSVGLFLLYATLLRNDRLGAGPRAATGLYLALLATSAVSGLHYMRVWYVWRLQCAAPVAWTRFFEPEASRLSFPLQVSVRDRAEYLETEGMLRQIRLAEAPDLSHYRVSKSPLPPSRAVVDLWVPPDDPPRLRATGYAFVAKGARPADLVLLVARDVQGTETVVAIAPMQAPQTYYRFDPQRKSPAARHYYGGWSCEVRLDALPPGKVTVRAYALDLPERRVYPIRQSEFLWQDGIFLEKAEIP